MLLLVEMILRKENFMFGVGKKKIKKAVKITSHEWSWLYPKNETGGNYFLGYIGNSEENRTPYVYIDLKNKEIVFCLSDDEYCEKVFEASEKFENYKKMAEYILTNDIYAIAEAKRNISR